MARQQCACGVVFRFSESAIGKRGKCKHCGAVFLLTGECTIDTIPIADESTSFGTGFVDDVRAPTGDAAPAFDRTARAETPSRSYGHDLLWTLLFPLSPGNWASYGVMCVALMMIPFFAMIPLVGWFLVPLVFGYYAAYRFAVVASAAAGEEDLPTTESDDLSMDGIVMALFKWIGSWIVVLLPVVVYSGVTAGADPSGIVRGLGGIVSVLMRDPVAVGLFSAGMFMWPMVVLCVALGGFSSLSRLDLIVRTIARTFPVYLLTVGVVFGSYFAGSAFGGSKSSSAPLIVGALGAVVSVYTEIVAMRAIGLYYHHFKHRFLWDWG